MFRRASLQGFVPHPGVYVQRSAATLAFGYDYFAAVALQHPDRCFVQAREAHVRDAARQQRHSVPPLSLRRKCAADLAEEERRLGGWRHYCQIAQRPEELDVVKRSNQRSQSARFVEVEQRAGRGQRRARLQQVYIKQAPESALKPPSRNLRLNLRPRILHHPAVWNSRRTRGFAPAASQAQVDMPQVRGRDGLALGHLNHLENPAAWRIHLEAEFPVGRAGVQAQPAVNAFVEVELLRPVHGCLLRYGHKVCPGSAG
jgi:hypothetical protein